MIAMFIWTLGSVIQAILLGLLALLAIGCGIIYAWLSLLDWVKYRKKGKGIGLKHLIKKQLLTFH